MLNPLLHSSYLAVLCTVLCTAFAGPAFADVPVHTFLQHKPRIMQVQPLARSFPVPQNRFMAPIARKKEELPPVRTAQKTETLSQEQAMQILEIYAQ